MKTQFLYIRPRAAVRNTCDCMNSTGQSPGMWHAPATELTVAVFVVTSRQRERRVFKFDPVDSEETLLWW